MLRRLLMKASVWAGLVLLSAALHAGSGQERRFWVELELGPVWQNRNNVEIPNDGTATRFSLVDLAGTGPWPAGRLYFTWNISERHGVRFLLAPLSYTETGTLDDPVIFVDQLFLPGVPTEATYQFNSWRASYRYRFHSGKRWRWWIGFTAKLRDAKIELEQGSVSAKDTDLGFVPLIYLGADWSFAGNWRFLLDLDALAGGPGRAEDLALKVGYQVGGRWMVAGGYRTVEGGADVEEVFNFAWFNSVVVSARYRWGSVP